MLNRREFLGLGAAAAVALAAVSRPLPRKGRFSRRYAPHFGMFRHHAGMDPIDQIKFLADEGFVALEDNGLRTKSPALQERMGNELARRGMTMGLFVGLADFGRATFASGSVDLRRGLLREWRSAVEAARRVGGRYLAVIPGKSVSGLSRSIQFRHAVDNLRFCIELCEKHDVVMLLEPIRSGSDASRLFLRSADQAAELCRTVGSPSCRLLFDVHEQAVRGENLTQLLSRTSDVLGYVQLADSPGRTEPGTGDVDFRKIFCVLDSIGYCGALGLEHGNRLPGRTGERAVIDAYRALESGHQRPDDASRAAACHLAMSSGLNSNTSIE